MRSVEYLRIKLERELDYCYFVTDDLRLRLRVQLKCLFIYYNLSPHSYAVAITKVIFTLDGLNRDCYIHDCVDGSAPCFNMFMIITQYKNINFPISLKILQFRYS